MEPVVQAVLEAASAASLGAAEVRKAYRLSTSTSATSTHSRTAPESHAPEPSVHDRPVTASTVPPGALDRSSSSLSQSEMMAVISRLKFQNAQLLLKNQRLEDRLKKWQRPGIEAILTEDMFTYYTGLPSKEVFESLLEFITPHLCRLYSKTGQSHGPQRQLSAREEFILVLMRLRLNLQERDLQYRFKLSSPSRVSKIFTAWVPFLASVLQPLMPWPSRKLVRKNMPTAFKKSRKYCNVRGILDCAEFEMEAPSALSLNAMSYSEYKSRNTVKVLFAVTPDGYVSFVSKAYCGSISDNSLTYKSGILGMCDVGDKLMADKGFTLSNTQLQPRGLATVLPPFRRGSESFTAEEVYTTKKVANLRIVVENCIMRIRYFRILRNRFAVSSVTLASAIVEVCAILTNLRPPLR